MNYFVAAVALKAASASPLTRATYRMLTRLKSGPRPAHWDRATWLLDELPEQDSRVLDLGTGWVHAYSLYLALLRNDELHCFDVSDNRSFGSFVQTVPAVLEQICRAGFDPSVQDHATRRAAELTGARNFAAAYQAAGMTYQSASSGIPDYPDDYFDITLSVDVLEHVDEAVFARAVDTWFRTLKPGGRFLAQVGIDDHLAFYEGKEGSKKYLQYSHRMWNRLLLNEVQYINRLTVSQIVALLQNGGFVIDGVETHDCELTRNDVHPDYRDQDENDIRAVRLFLKAHKP